MKAPSLPLQRCENWHRSYTETCVTIDDGDGMHQFSSLVSVAGLSILNQSPLFDGGFMNVIVPPLPYAMDALEPYISRRTLAAHFGRHHVGYVDKTRRLIDGTQLESAPIQEIVQASRETDNVRLFAAAAQAWNHSFYWSSMSPLGSGEAKGLIAEHLEASFGNQSAFRQQFIAAASDHLGSGWIWLVLDGEHLKILTTNNADTPLATTLTPLLVLDVWEHAYYLDYQHRRLDYISAFMSHLVNWNFAEANLQAALNQPDRPRSRWASVASAAAVDIPVRGVRH